MRQFEHGGNLYAAARQTGGSPDDYLDFSANINPLGIPGSVRQAILSAVDSIIHYPDAEATALKQAISRQYGVTADRITAGNGAVELLYLLCHALRPRRVLIPAPAFSEYERAARAAGAAIEYHFLRPGDGFAVPLEPLIDKLAAVDMLFLGNPNNPTAVLCRRQQLERLLTAARERQVTVVVDESFLDFLPDDSAYSCRPLLASYPHLFILHSLTKFYALPGLRLGFALTDPALTARLCAGKDPWNVNCLAQAAGVAALTDQDYRSRSRRLLTGAKAALYQRLSAIPGLKAYPPAVNFILLDIAATGLTAAKLCQALLKQRILVRDCSNYPGLSPYYIRVAVKRPEENQLLLQALQTVLAGNR